MKLGAHPLIVGVTAVFVTLLIAAIIFPVLAQSPGHVPRARCYSNLKQLGMAEIMYDGDNDAFPPRDAWYSAVAQPYLKATTPDRFQCPELRESKSKSLGYAFNGALSQKPQAKIPHPELVTMLYDSVNPTPNASDLTTSLPSPGRHGGNNTIAFADAHVKSVPRAVK